MPDLPADAPHAATPKRLLGHPVGLVSLFFTEMWERFSYYGMRALLVLFMTDQIASGGMGLDEVTATAIYGLYTALVYLVALPGGFIADRLLGAQRSVLIGGVIIALGHFTLAIPREAAFYCGLILIVAGTGLLKPNISVIVGQLYPDGDARRDAGFTIFYMGINLGAALGPLVCSTLGENQNLPGHWHYGFAAAGVGMLAGLVFFLLTSWLLGDAGRRPEHRRDPAAGFDFAWLAVIAAGAAVLACLVLAITFGRFFALNAVVLNRFAIFLSLGLAAAYFVVVAILGGLSAVEWKRMAVLVVLLLASAAFWAGFEQAGSSLNLFAERYTLRELGTLNFTIPAGWFQSLNPVFIIALAPVVASLWTLLAAVGRNPSVIAKFAFGLLLLGMGFLIMVAASALLTTHDRVWPTWLIGTYFVHTLGELCLSPVGLSAVTKLSPKRLAGQMMGMWFLASAQGSLVAGMLAGEIAATLDAMIAGYRQIAIFGIVAGIVLLLLAWPLNALVGRDEPVPDTDLQKKPPPEPS